MRVLVVGSANLVHVEPYLRHMVRAGWDVHWWVTAPGPVRVEGVTVWEGHSGKAYTGDARKLDYFRQGLRLRRKVSAIAPDIIHAHYASSAGLMAWMSGFRPYAVTIHGSDLMERSRTWVGAFLFPCGDWRRLAEIIVSLPGRRDGILHAVRQNRVVVEGRGDRHKNMEILMERLAETARPAGGD